MVTPSAIRSEFYNVLQQAADNRSAFVRSPGNMSRNKKSNFQDTLSFIFTLGTDRLNTELLHFFQPVPSKLPTKSAIIQQRNKFNEDLFPYLFAEFNRAFRFSKLYCGYQLIACDGSDINLPTNGKDTENRISYVSGKGCYYQQHLNALYDLREKRFIDVVMQPRPKMNESQALCLMVDRGPSVNNRIYIADRGYVTFNVMAHIIEKKQKFLIRMKKPSAANSFLKHYNIPSDAPYDQELCLNLTRSYVAKYRKHPEIYKCLSHPEKFDFLTAEDPDAIYPMKLRIVCLEISDGVWEYLLTNLSKDEFSPRELKKLYFMRWGIETGFRSLKYAVGLASFHSFKRDLIMQEVYARLILFNFASLLAAYGQLKYLLEKKHGKRRETKLNYQIAFDSAVAIARELIKHKQSNTIIKALLLKHLSPIRPDRQMPRNLQSQKARPLNNRA